MSVDPKNEALNERAWSSFVLWAYEQAEIRAEFSRVTGVVIPNVAVGIEKLIDQATGRDESKELNAALLKFVEWITVNEWGLEYAPKKLRERLQCRPVD